MIDANMVKLYISYVQGQGGPRRDLPYRQAMQVLEALLALVEPKQEHSSAHEG